jgi:hypothetical protein
MTTSWTAADAAELDVLLWELTGAWETHRPTCRERPCPHLQEAIAVVIEWRQARELRSRAEELRHHRARFEARRQADEAAA